MAACRSFLRPILPMEICVANNWNPASIPEEFIRKWADTLVTGEYICEDDDGNQWKIHVVVNGDIGYFEKGWEEFITDHGAVPGAAFAFDYEAPNKFQFTYVEADMGTLSDFYTLYMGAAAEIKDTDSNEELMGANHVGNGLNVPQKSAGVTSFDSNAVDMTSTPTDK